VSTSGPPWRCITIARMVFSTRDDDGGARGGLMKSEAVALTELT
jgi:hypothetical protein